MSSVTEAVQDVRSAAVRDRAMEGLAAVLRAGRPLTFKEVAAESGVPERTLYRHFPTRDELLAAAFDWANRRIGAPDHPPTDAAAATALVRTAFPGFDEIAPVVRQLLAAPEGVAVRTANRRDRQRAAAQLVTGEVPGLGRAEQRKVAAVVQVLTTASTWQALRDHWEMDGAEAAEAVAHAITLILEGARARHDT